MPAKQYKLQSGFSSWFLKGRVQQHVHDWYISFDRCLNQDLLEVEKLFLCFSGNITKPAASGKRSADGGDARAMQPARSKRRAALFETSQKADGERKFDLGQQHKLASNRVFSLCSSAALIKHIRSIIEFKVYA